ncbi:MAG: hypothetical protein ACI4SD_00845 [Suilimivivens sp.]
MHDADGNTVYEIDGTVPLKTLFIYDKNHNEVFRLTKELAHVLATYRFYYRGELYGTLEKSLPL